jgi:exonuclease III
MSSELPFNSIVDDFEYKDNLNSFFCNINDIFFQSVENMVFNPFEINDSTNEYPLDDLDPDRNYFNNAATINNVSNCKYYFEDLINTKFNTDINSLNLFHHNIRSTQKNFLDLQYLLSNLNIKFTIIGITETWLSETNVDLHEMTGYSSEHNYRKHKRGGGVSLYIQDHIEYKCRPDLTELNEILETIFIEIPKDQINSDKSVIIGVLYRPPNTDIHRFNEALENTLQKISNEHKYLYLLGDFNINLMNTDTHIPTSEFLDIMYSHSLLPLITKPTRITDQTFSLIDNIFYNDVNNNNYENGIIYTDITDHFPIFSIKNYSKVASRVPITLKIRNYSKRNIEKFCDKLATAKWTQLFCIQNAQDAFTYFYEQYCSLYNECFPFKSYKSEYHNNKPWLSIGIKNSIKTKNKLYYLSKKYPTELNKTKYKEYRNKIHSLIKKTEKKFYEDKLKQNQSNIKKSWCIIKEIINKKINKQISNEFIINGHKTSNKNTIATAFNQYYVNVGPTLAKSIPPVNINPTSYIEKYNENTLFLNPTCSGEIKTIIKNLKDSSPGYDDIQVKIIKLTQDYYVAILAHLINMSLTQGLFPNELKIARVIPIYKANDPLLVNNYRPISVLPALSKIYEKIFYNRILKFLNQHNILYKYQFGFRQNYNTSLALTVLLDEICNAFNNNEIVFGIFLDFRKAFDTLDHNILKAKLQKYGIRGKSFEWLTSYLQNRKQFVSFNNTKSTHLPITCGVPQGSILGPLLFLIYVNDISNISELTLPILFADDTNLFFKGKQIENITLTINRELDNIYKWINANKLSLNIDKTNYMIFKPKNKKIQSDINITINNNNLIQVNSSKFLGVILDENLSWFNHISYIKTKISKGLGIIKKTRKFFNDNIIRTLYHSFIFPYLTYCLEIWGSAAETHLNLLLKVQKQYVRIATHSDFRAHTNDLFKKLNILPIEKLYHNQILIFMYKINHKMLPEIFISMFNYVNETHAYQTRNRLNFSVPQMRLTTTQITIRYMGVKLWNYYTQKLENSKSIHIFKKKIKAHLHQNILPIFLH